MNGAAFNDRLDATIALVVKTMRENGQSRAVMDFIVAELLELRAASGMEAPSGGETGTGSTVGDSPTAESGDAQ